MNSQELVESLRKMADFYEAHPNVIVPYLSNIDAFVYRKDDLIATARDLGTCTKGADDNYFYLKKAFGSITVSWNLARAEACRRVVVGKRTIPAHFVPEVQEDVVEWHCEPVLKPGEEDSAALLEAPTVPEEMPF